MVLWICWNLHFSPMKTYFLYKIVGSDGTAIHIFLTIWPQCDTIMAKNPGYLFSTKPKHWTRKRIQEKNSAKTQRIEREKMIDWYDAPSDRNENISGIWNIHKKEKWCVNLFRSCFPSPVFSYKPKKRARSGEREMEILLPRRRFNTLKSITFLLLLLPSLRRQ